jgi:3-hydroxybutyryl-CoA dehydratase
MMLPPRLVESRFLVDRVAIRRYADVTQDFNPIHLDPEFAARTPMGGVIAHGMLSLSLIWQSLEATFGTEQMSGIELDVRFIRPVREDDWVSAAGARVGETTTYQVWVQAERHGAAEAVISGTATLGDARDTDGSGR